MFSLLKVCAALAVICGSMGHKIPQANPQSLPSAVSCIAHPSYCVQGLYIYHKLNPGSQNYLNQLEQSYVEIGQIWDKVSVSKDA